MLSCAKPKPTQTKTNKCLFAHKKEALCFLFFTILRMKTEVFAVNGMQSELCKAQVESAIKQLVGVERVAVDLPNKLVRITYNEDLISPIQFKNAIEGLGMFEMIL